VISPVESLCYVDGHGNPAADTNKTPALVAFVMVVAGIAIAAAQGIVHGSLVGGIIAAAEPSRPASGCGRGSTGARARSR
jgi:hypothetical protein